MCIGSNGKKLRDYLSEAEAMQAADYVGLTFGNQMLPYKCEKCRFWHLSPKERYTPSQYCFTCGKELYQDKQSGQKRAQIIYMEKGVKLNLYRCNFNVGWHLTSKK